MNTPSAARSPWLRNCWYVIAGAHEVPPHGLFARTVLGEPIVVFRTATGYAALEDRCCHRHAPLSVGRHEGDCVRCGYHGLKFDASGRCVAIPGLEVVPEHVRVRSYPLQLKNKWLFVWMGDPARADATLLPDNFSCDSVYWVHLPGYMRYDTPYLLICDNLLDFSHLSYVHEKSLGGSTAIAEARPTIEPVTAPGQRGIKVSRLVRDVPPPPFYRRFRSFDGNLDRWFIYDFLLPGTLLMHSGGRPVGDAPDDMRRAVRLHSCQTLTPETETSTHYFFQQSHPAGEGGGDGDGAIAESIYQSLLGAFNEDRDMITAQARNMSASAPMVPLHMDSALIRFRQLLQRELDAERALTEH